MTTHREHMDQVDDLRKERDKLRADLTKAEASIVEHKAELAALRNDRDRAQTAVGEHKASAFRFAAENERLRAVVEAATNFVNVADGYGMTIAAGEALTELESVLDRATPSEGDPRG